MTATDNNKNPEKIEDLTARKVNLTSKEVDTDKNRSVTIPTDNMGSVFADNVKVLFDDGTRICTLLFFKKHVTPKQTERGIDMDAIYHEAVMEVKLPYESAFLLALYMNEVYKKLQAGERGQIRFGP